MHCLQQKLHLRPNPAAMRHARRLPATAAKKGGDSPWSTGPAAGGSKGSSSKGGGGNRGKSSKSGPRKPNSNSGSSSSSNKSGSRSGKKSSTPSGVGFGPAKPEPPPLHKLTAPLTPQLLDELSGWEAAPAPLWGTFTGHCEGEWLGQYSAYTPWAGDPEPVWADDSGAYLPFAFSRASEERQQLALAAEPAQGDGYEAAEAAAAAAGEELVDSLVRTTVRSASISALIGGVSAANAAATAAAERAAGAATAAAAAAAAAAASPPPAAAAAVADDESESFAFNRDGSVVFNGGSYSLGPELIDPPEVDADDFQAALAAAQEAAAAAGGDGSSSSSTEEAVLGEALASLPFSTAVIEQVLVASGDVRLRLVLTLKLRQPPGEELDVEIARMLLYKEFWYGTAESTAHQRDGPGGSSVLSLVPAHAFDTPVIALPRPQPSQLAGSWNVFLTAATPLVEENPDTLLDEQVFAYSSREERQQWHVPGLTSSAALGSGGSSSSSSGGSSSSSSGGSSSSSSGGSSNAGSSSGGVEELDAEGSGGSFWLPGGAIVSVRMVPQPQPQPAGAGDDGASSSSAGSGRGLLVGLHWLADSGSCVFLERQYGPDGELAEVRHGSAVKGGWSGGRM